MKFKIYYKLFKKHGWKYFRALIVYGIITKLLNWDTFKRLNNFGDFHFKDDYSGYAILSAGNKTGFVNGGIVKFIKDIEEPINNALLTGEPNYVKNTYAELLRINQDKIFTAGIDKDVDFFWNFEKNIPQDLSLKKFSLIVSQSMLEHLIDPFKHISDLIILLDNNGYLIIDTVMPGLGYHRFPIDCFRFYPDWFEEIAKRKKLKVVDKHITHAQIYYKFKKV
jgi:hypothetical protein